MALQKQIVSLNLTGLDTKTDSKQVVQGKLLTLENGVFTTERKIRKRYGYNPFSRSIEGSSALIASGSALATYNSELLLFSGSELYSYSPSTLKWSDKGSITNVNLTVQPIIRNSYQQTSPDSAYHSSGLKIFAYEDSRGGSRYSIVDSVTGQFLVSDQLINSTAAKPKVLAVGNYFYLVYYDSAITKLRLIIIPVLTPTAPRAAIDLAANILGSAPNFDMTLAGGRAYLAYNNTDGGHGVSVKFIDSFGTLSATLDITGENASSCIGIFVDSVTNQVFVAYHNGTAVRYFVRDSALSPVAVLAPTTVETVANVVSLSGISANGSATLFYTVSAAQTYNYFIRSNTISASGTVGTAADFKRSVGLASKAFSYNGHSYVTVAFASVLQPTYFVLDSLGNIVAKFVTSQGGGQPAKNCLPEVNALGSGNYLLACLEKDLLTSISGTIYTQTGVKACTLNFASQLQHATLGQSLILTGGFVSSYDGVSPTEHNFHIYPENVTVSTSASGGLITAGTYSYAVCYEWADASGQIQRSSPSIGVQQVTTGSTSTNTVTIPTLRLTGKQNRSPVFIVVYRTLANGSTFFQVSSVTSPLLNSTTSDSVTFTDTFADTTIQGNPYLYTTGNVVQNTSPPAANLITTFQNRVVLIPSEDPLSFYYSKQVVQGSPVDFSINFQNKIDARGGPITTAAEMDGNLILFKNSSIYYVSGSGPADTGANNNFSDAILVSTDGGCTNPSSVILTPEGLMYKSQKGIYLLSRALKVSYIGKEVEAYNSANITSAVLIPNTNQVRFTLDSGLALVYDYFENQWGTFTNLAAQDATTFQNQYVYLNAAGSAFQETPGLFIDGNGQGIKLKMVTSWLSFAGLQGYQRIYKMQLLGDYISAHKLLVQIAYDFNPNAIQQNYIDAATLIGPMTYGSDATYGASAVYGGAYPQYQWRVDPAQQKCESIQISIEDIQSSNFGEGFSLSAIAFQVGLKAGFNPMSAKASFG
jgi:hypothetical protein